MPAATTRNLFIQIGGSASELTIATKAGKSALLELGDGANDLQATVRNAFVKLGGTVDDQAKAMEQSYARTFANIRATAESALKAPSGKAQSLFIDVGGARDEAAKLQSVADFYRQLADAQARLVESGAEVSAQARAEATSLELLAISYGNNAAAAREAVAGLERLAVESGVATDELAKLAARETDAAAAALEAAQAQEQLANRSDRLLSSIDPIYAAQQRYNATIGEASSLLTEGAISAERYAQVQTIAAQALREVADAAGVAAERQRDLYATQAAAARIEVRGNQAQDAIAQSEQLVLANKSAADSFEFFRKVGVAEAQDIQVFESTTVQAVVDGSQRMALANKSAAASFDVFRAAGIAEAQGAAEVTGAHNRLGASSLIADHVIRSFSDSLTAGQPPVRAFALELPRITEAMQFLATESNATEGFMARFAGFMGGPWGLALVLGTAVLAPLIENLFEAGDAAKQAKTAEQDYAKQQGDLADAIDKANGRLVERNRLLSAIALQEKRPEVEAAQTQSKTSSDQAFSAARAIANPLLYGSVSTRASLGTAVSNGANPDAFLNPAVKKAIDSANGDVVKLRDNLDALARQASGPSKAGLEKLADAVNHLTGMSVAAGQQAARLRGDAAETAIALRGGTVLTTESVQRGVEQKNATTPLEKAQIALRVLNDQKADLDKMPYSPAQQAALEKWAKDLDTATAKVKALQEAQKDARGSRQVGRQIDLSQAEDIVRGIGGQITSTTRSKAEQQVLYDRYRAGTGPLAAVPGTSEHERGQAIDVAKTAGVSLGALKKAFEDAGVHLTEALDEGNHYHVAFGPKGPSADTLARREQSADTKAANQDGAFQSELRTALDGLAAAREKLPQTPEQEYSTTGDKLQDDFIQRSAGLEDKVAAGKLTAAEAVQIEAILNATLQLNDESAKRKELAALLDQQIKAEDASIEARNGLLQTRLEGTDGRQAQKGLAEQVLANKQQKERDDLGTLLAPGSSATDEQKQAAAIKLQSLPDQQAAERTNLQRQYASPGQKYLQGLNGTSIGDGLEQVEVDGLGKLQDGLASVLDGTKSVKGAFKEMATSIVSDLIRIGIEQAIIKPLANSLFGGAGATAGGGGILSFIGSIFGHADGGHISGPGTGKSDSILARLSNGEFVVNAASTQRFLPMLHAINDNKLPGFADGGLIGGISSMPTLGPREIREIHAPSIAPRIVVQVEEGALFRPVVHSISGQHAQVAESNATEAGAQLAMDRAQWKQGRQLGGSR